MNTRWKAFLEKRTWDLYQGLRIVRTNYDGRSEVMLPPEVQSYESGAFIDAKPFLESGYAGQMGDVEGFLQAMLNLAWGEGMRPTGFADVKNEIAAVRYHLEDMRKLALPKDSG